MQQKNTTIARITMTHHEHDIAQLKHDIQTLWHSPRKIPEKNHESLLRYFLELLDVGMIRVVEPGAQKQWHINTWCKQGILLCFKYLPCYLQQTSWGATWDKFKAKTSNWTEKEFQSAGYRSYHVGGGMVRHGAYIAPGVIQGPSFVNVGAYVGEHTLLDTWSTVGSCAYIGKNCHISGGVGIGGVLEPLQARPVIIEDNCFIGARSEVVEGVIVRQGAVLGMGVFLSASTPIVHRHTGEISYGKIPENVVVLPGTLPSKPVLGGAVAPHMSCVIIVKDVSEDTRKKTSINMILRDASISLQTDL